MTSADDALCDALASDLPGHFSQLVERFQQRLFAFALRLTASRQDAEDIVQEAFVGAYVSLENYPPQRIRTLRLQAWLYKVTLYAWQHQRRAHPPEGVSLAPLAESNAHEVADAFEEQPARFFERLEQRQEVLASLALLPERYRIPLTCYYLEHLSYQEIADLLDQPMGTTKSAIHRGLAQLRVLLTSQETSAGAAGSAGKEG